MVSGVSVQVSGFNLQLPDTRTLTPVSYNIILLAHLLRQPAPLIKGKVFEEVYILRVLAFLFIKT